MDLNQITLKIHVENSAKTNKLALPTLSALGNLMLDQTLNAQFHLKICRTFQREHGNSAIETTKTKLNVRLLKDLAELPAHGEILDHQLYSRANSVILILSKLLLKNGNTASTKKLPTVEDLNASMTMVSH